MIRDNLGKKQKKNLSKCSIIEARYDLAITPHKQKEEYIKSKTQQQKQAIISKQKKLLKKSACSRTKNAVSEVDSLTRQELGIFRDLLHDKTNQLTINVFF